MRRGILAFAAVGLLATSGLAACGDDSDSGGDDAGNGDKTYTVGVILPDSASSDRWETADRRFLEQAFEAAGVKHNIQNANNDKTAFQTIADQMLAEGVDVLMTVNLDSGTGKAVLAKAQGQGVPTIDYDRLTEGGGAQYYVSFDNEKVGQLQGEGLVKCLAEKQVANPAVAYLNGSPTDNNASLFKNGYDSVLKPKFDAKEYTFAGERDVPNWDAAQAATLFEQMMTQSQNKINGVLAANDTLGNSAITILKKNGLNGTVPVTGQDASVQGLQNILAGDQCMTVYKAIKKEADAAAELAVALAKGETKETTATVKDPVTGKDVPSVLLEPVAIDKTNVQAVIDDGYVTKEQVCSGAFAALCTQAGIK